MNKMPTLRKIDRTNFVDTLTTSHQPWFDGYYALYSSLLQGVTTDPALMLLPIDDHLVHRGDGVFDTGKCVNGGLYNFEAHLDRLLRSAAAIGIEWPAGRDDIMRLTLATLRHAGKRDCSVRVILARGPGSFGVSPYDSPKPALYIVVYALGKPFMQRHPAGATLRRSAVPCKESEMAAVKNCNYLPNVMMKRESIDHGVDFVVSFDKHGYMAEGATENIGIVNAAGELLFPRLENILAGTTMLRLLELAEELVADGTLRAIGHRDISEEDIFNAREVLVVGTTINLVAVCHYEGRPIANGQPGPLWHRLGRMLEEDIASNPALRIEL